jgi:hypothetical protein
LLFVCVTKGLEWLSIRDGSSYNGWRSGQCNECHLRTFLVTCPRSLCPQPNSGVCQDCLVKLVDDTRDAPELLVPYSRFVQCDHEDCYEFLHSDPSIGCVNTFNMSCSCHTLACSRCAGQCYHCHQYNCRTYSCIDCRYEMCEKCIHPYHLPDGVPSRDRCTPCQRRYLNNNRYNENELSDTIDTSDEDDINDNDYVAPKQREPNEPWYDGDDDHIAKLPSTWKPLNWKHWRYHQYNNFDDPHDDFAIDNNNNNHNHACHCNSINSNPDARDNDNRGLQQAQEETRASELKSSSSSLNNLQHDHDEELDTTGIIRVTNSIERTTSMDVAITAADGNDDDNDNDDYDEDDSNSKEVDNGEDAVECDCARCIGR